VTLRTISLVLTLVVFVYGTYVMSQSDVVIVQEHWLVCILLSNENDDFISFASLLMSKKLNSDVFVVGHLVVITPFISPNVIKLESSYLIHTGIWASCINLSEGHLMH